MPDVRTENWEVSRGVGCVEVLHNGRLVAVLYGNWFRGERLEEIPVGVLGTAMQTAAEARSV